MSDWMRGPRTDLAVERVLDAAGQVFVERGIAGTGMADIARAAGCSRATIYRYFENRDALRTAFVNREALRVARAVALSVADVDNPAERLAAAVLGAVDHVRGTPTLAAWFTPTDQGFANQLAAASGVIDALAVGFLGDVEHRAEARWMVRVIVSLLTMPGRDAADERAIVEQFAVPALLAGGQIGPRRGSVPDVRT
jgi:AcrR family transcriptional regulator